MGRLDLDRMEECGSGRARYWNRMRGIRLRMFTLSACTYVCSVEYGADMLGGGIVFYILDILLISLTVSWFIFFSCLPAVD